MRNYTKLCKIKDEIKMTYQKPKQAAVSSDLNSEVQWALTLQRILSPSCEAISTKKVTKRAHT